MLEFLSENYPTLIVGAIVLAGVSAAVLKLVRDKRRHKGSCSCGCAGCPSARRDGLCGKHPA